MNQRIFLPHLYHMCTVRYKPNIYEITFLCYGKENNPLFGYLWPALNICISFASLWDCTTLITRVYVCNGSQVRHETSPGGGFPKENISFSTYSYFHHPEKFVASTLSMLFEYEESSNSTDWTWVKYLLCCSLQILPNYQFLAIALNSFVE